MPNVAKALILTLLLTASPSALAAPTKANTKLPEELILSDGDIIEVKINGRPTRLEVRPDAFGRLTINLYIRFQAPHFGEPTTENLSHADMSLQPPPSPQQHHRARAVPMHRYFIVPSEIFLIGARQVGAGDAHDCAAF